LISFQPTLAMAFPLTSFTVIPWIDVPAAGAKTDHADVPRNKTHQHKHERSRRDQCRDHEHPMRPILSRRDIPRRLRTDIAESRHAYLSSPTLAKS